MHSNIELTTRCELALSGFLCLDLFRMTAEEKTLEMKMPKGSGFMAAQTVGNLQGCCLSIISIALTLNPSWQPWRHGHARLSELPIEQWFSFLRAQSPNSQLSARGFFQASCRMSMKNNKVLLSEKPVPAGSQGALTDDEFCRCCERAWKASLALVSFASGIKEQLLEGTYRKMCKDEPGVFDVSENEIHQEEEEVDALEEKEEEECEGNECLKLISCIQRETLFVDKNFEDDLNVGEDNNTRHEDIAGGEELKALLQELKPAERQDPKPQASQSGERMPSTLLEAMQDTGDTFNALFRLAVRLRSSKGGADLQWISNARNARRASLKLNWHQRLGLRNEHIIAQLNLEEETPQYRSRTARLAKWKELMVNAQKQLELPAAVPESNEPSEGGGRFEIVLTEDSAEVLTKTENIKKWKVPHTMTRGSKNAGTEPIQKTQKRVIKLVSKFAKKVEKSKAAKKKKSKKEKKEKKEKPQKEEKAGKKSAPAAEALGPDSIRRTAAGHAAILKKMEILFDLGAEKFVAAPAFNDDGTCRMKFDGANKITWREVYKVSPKVFESMYLSQYRHTTTGKAYGKIVWNHLESIQRKLEQSEPSRQGWLRLIKEISEYLMAVAHAPKNKGDSNGSEKN
eukprot:s3829_g6.t1